VHPLETGHAFFYGKPFARGIFHGSDSGKGWQTTIEIGLSHKKEGA
jgi:hypothetical protein